MSDRLLVRNRRSPQALSNRSVTDDSRRGRESRCTLRRRKKINRSHDPVSVSSVISVVHIFSFGRGMCPQRSGARLARTLPAQLGQLIAAHCEALRRDRMSLLHRYMQSTS